MNARILRTIAVKDLKEVAQNRAAWIPAVVIPLTLLALLPLVVILAPRYLNISATPLLSEAGPVGMMMRNAPGLTTELAGLSQDQTWVVMMTGYLLAPFILIMPLMFSTIIGAESFVGEKERKTVEALIHSPISDGELFVGKTLASVLPAVVLTWVSFLVYGVVVNVASFEVMGRVWFPPPTWWPLVLWVAPAVATLGMAVTVLISTRVNTFMEAYQMSASLVVVVLALVVGQVTGILYLSVGMALAIGGVTWLTDAVLIRIGIRSFRREKLLSGL
jgi:ABC-2 type transport system permease protein